MEDPCVKASCGLSGPLTRVQRRAGVLEEEVRWDFDGLKYAAGWEEWTGLGIVGGLCDALGLDELR